MLSSLSSHSKKNYPWNLMSLSMEDMTDAEREDVEADGTMSSLDVLTLEILRMDAKVDAKAGDRTKLTLRLMDLFRERLQDVCPNFRLVSAVEAKKCVYLLGYVADESSYRVHLDIDSPLLTVVKWIPVNSEYLRVEKLKSPLRIAKGSTFIGTDTHVIQLFGYFPSEAGEEPHCASAFDVENLHVFHCNRKEVSAMPTCRKNAAACWAPGRQSVVMFGGLSLEDGDSLCDLWELKVEMTLWGWRRHHQVCKRWPIPRRSASLAVYDDTIYLFGGQVQSGEQTCVGPLESERSTRRAATDGPNPARTTLVETLQQRRRSDIMGAISTCRTTETLVRCYLNDLWSFTFGGEWACLSPLSDEDHLPVVRAKAGIIVTDGKKDPRSKSWLKGPSKLLRMTSYSKLGSEKSRRPYSVLIISGTSGGPLALQDSWEFRLETGSWWPHLTRCVGSSGTKSEEFFENHRSVIKSGSAFYVITSRALSYGVVEGMTPRDWLAMCSKLVARVQVLEEQDHQRNAEKDVRSMLRERIPAMTSRIASIYDAPYEARHLGECIVCVNNSVQVVFDPCGHVIMCWGCIVRLFRDLGSNTCPLCRMVIKRAMRLRFSNMPPLDKPLEQIVTEGTPPVLIDHEKS